MEEHGTVGLRDMSYRSPFLYFFIESVKILPRQDSYLNYARNLYDKANGIRFLTYAVNMIKKMIFDKSVNDKKAAVDKQLQKKFRA